MKPFVPFLCLTLLFLSGALSSVPPIPPMPVIPEDCKATVFQAGLALEEINKDREEGFVVGLYRVVDAHRQPVGAGNIYYFTIDVLETDCHIVSRKSWKDCNLTPFNKTIYGQCKAILYLSLPLRRVKLYGYNCILNPVHQPSPSSMCPDCPTPGEDAPSYQSVADIMVAKYNKDSNNTHYYKDFMIELTYVQRVDGLTYFLEFVIKETNCSKSETHVTDCHFLEDEQAHLGYCKGSQISKLGEDGVSVSCEIYEPKKIGLPRMRHHVHHSKDHVNVHIFHEFEFDPSGRIVYNPEASKDHHKEKHEENHEHESPSGEPHIHPVKKPVEGSSAKRMGGKPIPPPPRGPIGFVDYYAMVNETDVFPSPSNPGPSHPITLPGSPPVQRHVGPEQPVVPGFIGHFHDPEPQPFPHHPSDSAGCPSDPDPKLPPLSPLYQKH
ncbi:histidine-rich glycoprotein-like [Lissotriton helveticus]